MNGDRRRRRTLRNPCLRNLQMFKSLVNPMELRETSIWVCGRLETFHSGGVAKTCKSTEKERVCRKAVSQLSGLGAVNHPYAARKLRVKKFGQRDERGKESA